jgi:hypothetical protein
LAARLSEVPNFATFTVEQAMEAFVGLVVDARAAAQIHTLTGYFIGGWNLQTHDPQCFQVLFQPGQNPIIEPMPVGMARFQGIPHFFTRAFHGYDPALPQRLQHAIADRLFLHQQQPLPGNYAQLFDQAFQDAIGPLVAAGVQDVPLRDAIDFVYSYIHITIKAHKFRFGPPPCGGPIEIAFISTDRSFRWALHKSFQTAMFEQEPTRE